jgi:large subunit ribosomal protein L10
LAITKERKEELVGQYTEQLEASKGLILTDYRGLRVTDMERLRRSLRKNEVTFQVVKNRLLRLALDQLALDIPQEWLEGPTALAFCHGEVPPAAKAMSDFAKETDALSIKGGLLGTSLLSPEQVKALAELPPREVLFAQVLGAINAPASQAAGVVASGIRQILNVLQAHVDKLGGSSPAPQAA